MVLAMLLRKRSRLKANRPLVVSNQVAPEVHLLPVCNAIAASVIGTLHGNVYSRRLVAREPTPLRGRNARRRTRGQKMRPSTYCASSVLGNTPRGVRTETPNALTGSVEVELVGKKRTLRVLIDSGA